MALGLIGSHVRWGSEGSSVKVLRTHDVPLDVFWFLCVRDERNSGIEIRDWITVHNLYG